MPLQWSNLLDCIPSQAAMPPVTYLSLDETSFLYYSKPLQLLVGSLLYISSRMRSNMAFAAGYLSRFIPHPTAVGWKCDKHSLTYRKGSSALGVKYTEFGSGEILGYRDSDCGQKQTG